MRSIDDMIRCPECWHDQAAEILIPVGEEVIMSPHPLFAHQCDVCGHFILESEWESVAAAPFAWPEFPEYGDPGA